MLGVSEKHFASSTRIWGGYCCTDYLGLQMKFWEKELLKIHAFLHLRLQVYQGLPAELLGRGRVQRSRVVCGAAGTDRRRRPLPAAAALKKLFPAKSNCGIGPSEIINIYEIPLCLLCDTHSHHIQSNATSTGASNTKK